MVRSETVKDRSRAIARLWAFSNASKSDFDQLLCYNKCLGIDRFPHTASMAMAEPLPEQTEIVRMLTAEREQALGQFFESVRPRLRQIVRFRLDYRLSGRVAESDVLQETFVRAARHIDRFLTTAEIPFFVWLRMELNQKLHEIHRYHFEHAKRDPRREKAFGPGQPAGNTSLAIAAQVVGGWTTPSRLVEKAEQIALVQQTLEELPELDREVIALRHFEELSNLEAAQVLGIEPSAASKRYLRALKRLKEIMAATGSFDGS
jgi:RNA polymerase sigma-70 factor (ECF subfamily)